MSKKNCQCTTEMLKKVKEKLKASHAPAEISDVEWQNMGFIIDHGTQLAFPISYRLQRKKKDGSDAKPVKKSANMYPSYCPFCGKKTGL